MRYISDRKQHSSAEEGSDGERAHSPGRQHPPPYVGKNRLLQSSQWSKSYDSVINYWNTSDLGGRCRPGPGGGSQHQQQQQCSSGQTTRGYGKPTGYNAPVKLNISPSATLASKLHRKVLRVPSKRIPGKVHPGKLASVASKLTAAKQRLHQQQQQQQNQLQQHQFNLQQLPLQRPPAAPSVNNCDNSNDSGLGFDRSLDSALGAQFQSHPNHTSSASTATVGGSGTIGRSIHHSSTTPAEDEGVESESGLRNRSATISVGRGARGGKPATTLYSNRRTVTRSVGSSRSSSTASTKSLKRSHLELDDATACSGDLFVLTTTSGGSIGASNSTIVKLSNPPAKMSVGKVKPAVLRTVAATKKIIFPVTGKSPSVGGGKRTVTIAPLSSNKTSLSSLSSSSSGSPSSLSITAADSTTSMAPAVTAAAASATPVVAKVMTSSLARPINRLPGKRPPLLSSSSSSLGGGGTASGAAFGVVTLQTPLVSSSQDGNIHLQILTQPEQQHRARYQTEGSRGAVKDRSGNGFPVVRLVGHTKPTVLQVFIGTDVGRVAPHMFYQACKVSGKNSTPCMERKLEGTMVIEVDVKPENEMTVTCDCVGILKERNVDVEHRFPDQSGPRAKKKSTRCRMVFRTTIKHDDGSVETLQVCSQPIVCTQPPGVPEICKKSLVSCPAEGGLEMFIIGKNFLKDTKVVFQRRKAPLGANSASISVIPWEQTVIPDKEYLQQTHLICTVPPYVRQDILEPVVVQIYIVSAGKKSETHNFTFTPKNAHTALTAATTTAVPAGGTFFGTLGSGETIGGGGGGGVSGGSGVGGGDSNGRTNGSPAGGGNTTGATGFASLNSSFGSNPSEDTLTQNDGGAGGQKQQPSLFQWGSQLSAAQDELDTGMMPPPVNVLLMGGNGRRPSLLGDQLSMSSPPNFKAELIDENSRSPHNEDSLERFPDSTDNSIDNSHILYRRRSVRQPSMDLMEDSSSMSMLINENSAMDVGAMSGSMVGFRTGLSTLMETNEISNSATSPLASELKVMDLCIKQEQQQLSATARNQIEHMIATSSGLGGLNEVNQIKAQLNVEGMLNAAVQQGSLEKQALESTIASMVGGQQQSGMLEMNSLTGNGGSALSPAMLHGDISNATSGHSPLSQDVMLNSQSTLTVPSPGNMVLSPASTTSSDVSSHPHSSISPEIILNPTVSPSSMICSPSNATVAATAAAAVAAAAAVSEGAGLLTNQVFNNMAAVAANMIEQQPKETTQAVQEIILNAAAEILTSQEPSVTTQSTINALISMNAQEMMTTSCQPQSQAIMSQQNLLPQCQPSTMASNVLTSALQQQQQMVQTLINESIQHQHHQQQQQQAAESLMLNLAAASHQQNLHTSPVPEQMEIGNPIMQSSGSSSQPPQQPMDTTAPLSTVSTTTLSQQQQQQQLQQHQQQTSPQQQQHLSAPVSTDPVQMTVGEQHHRQQQQQAQQQQQQQQQHAAAVAAANIPQELTIMSDNDLISYINPSAFDAV
ncbi:nuclear factor of activated T-cells 5 isoform X2 [Topomyia yanbarensis]|uniref:nuclear factor of activated T-cells 5 isoform X2 n=1 Tax=Topomyia yanbarensis TaxID=2498891 RepID=UPI00273C3D37|nr:nuclear factor of activated T-cells 5 isoform X2 [Topomyia yanbarensis]